METHFIEVWLGKMNSEAKWHWAQDQALGFYFVLWDHKLEQMTVHDLSTPKLNIKSAWREESCWMSAQNICFQVFYDNIEGLAPTQFSLGPPAWIHFQDGSTSICSCRLWKQNKVLPCVKWTGSYGVWICDLGLICCILTRWGKRPRWWQDVEYSGEVTLYWT